MKYRITQGQITDNLNFIDGLFEKEFSSSPRTLIMSITEQQAIGNGLHQIEADVESLCSYIDSLTKTIKDIDFQLSTTHQAYDNLEKQLKQYETTLGISTNV